MSSLQVECVCGQRNRIPGRLAARSIGCVECGARLAVEPPVRLEAEAPAPARRSRSRPTVPTTTDEPEPEPEPEPFVLSAGARWVLAIALCGFSAYMPMAWLSGKPGPAGALVLIPAGLCALGAIACLVEGAARSAILRFLALSLFVVLSVLVVRLVLEGKISTTPPASASFLEAEAFDRTQPSAIKTGAVLVVFGVPALVYALTGRWPWFGFLAEPTPPKSDA